MLRGIYTSVAGLHAAEQRQQILANNLVNANTPGYKSDDVTSESFENLLRSLGDPRTPGTGVLREGYKLDLSQGPITETGAPLDLALSGDGFFTIAGPDGPLYTRAGRFTQDAAGTLRSVDGYAVLSDTGQPIVAPGNNVQVLQDGIVLADGVPAGRLGVVTHDPATLTRAGAATFSATGGGTPANALVLSGRVEGSNVDSTAVMSTMMMLVRAFEASRSAVQIQNETLQQTVGQVGSVR